MFPLTRKPETICNGLGFSRCASTSLRWCSTKISKKFLTHQAKLHWNEPEPIKTIDINDDFTCYTPGTFESFMQCSGVCSVNDLLQNFYQRYRLLYQNLLWSFLNFAFLNCGIKIPQLNLSFFFVKSMQHATEFRIMLCCLSVTGKIQINAHSSSQTQHSRLTQSYVMHTCLGRYIYR